MRAHGVSFVRRAGSRREHQAALRLKQITHRCVTHGATRSIYRQSYCTNTHARNGETWANDNLAKTIQLTQLAWERNWEVGVNGGRAKEGPVISFVRRNREEVCYMKDYVYLVIYANKCRELSRLYVHCSGQHRWLDRLFASSYNCTFEQFPYISAHWQIIHTPRMSIRLKELISIGDILEGV